MIYKYITDNNLWNKQTYMYSEYGDMEFLESYLETRVQIINNLKCSNAPNSLNKDDTYNKLEELYFNLEKSGFTKMNQQSVNYYVKSFEVRKRLYSSYAIDQKPCINASFDNYDNYLLFAKILVTSYQLTHCLKYFSCLLKLDDTLLSVACLLNISQAEILKQIIKQELNFFWDFMDILEISQDWRHKYDII